jgi:beta-glucanase (GH16 family)
MTELRFPYFLFKSSLCFLLILSISQISAQNPGCAVAPIWYPSWPSWACSDLEYILVFEDNFEGSALDQSKWQLQPWGHGSLAGDGSQQHYLLENLEIENGTAKIFAKQETLTLPIMPWFDDATILEDGSPNLRTFNFSSSNIWSRNSFFYGRYEIRCRLPIGTGFWPAFWTFGGGNPIDWNEIDVFEIYGNDIDRFTCNLHHNWLGNDQSNCGYGQDVTDFSQWNTIRCDFEFDRVSWYVNDVLIRSVPRFQTITLQPLDCSAPLPGGNIVTNKAYPTGRMNIIFNMAVQSGSNSPISSTTFPGVFEIDYIRHCRKVDCCTDLSVSSNEGLNLLADNAAYNFLCGENVSISGEVQLEPGRTLHVKAGNSISLKPNLHITSQSYFQAEINPEICPYRETNQDINSLGYKSASESTSNKISVSLSPNPATNESKITIFSNLHYDLSMTVYNLQGKTLLTKNIMSNQTYSINLNGMEAGSYFIVVADHDGKIIQRKKLINI